MATLVSIFIDFYRNFAQSHTAPRPLATRSRSTKWLESIFTDILAGFTFNNRVLRFPAIVLVLNTRRRPEFPGRNVVFNTKTIAGKRRTLLLTRIDQHNLAAHITCLSFWKQRCFYFFDWSKKRSDDPSRYMAFRLRRCLELLMFRERHCIAWLLLQTPTTNFGITWSWIFPVLHCKSGDSKDKQSTSIEKKRWKVEWKPLSMDWRGSSRSMEKRSHFREAKSFASASRTLGSPLSESNH